MHHHFHWFVHQSIHSTDQQVNAKVADPLLHEEGIAEEEKGGVKLIADDEEQPHEEGRLHEQDDRFGGGQLQPLHRTPLLNRPKISLYVEDDVDLRNHYKNKESFQAS
ncbi:hypothetical protein TYRP_023004 [Tyrophagus putrescentiae]|nr:hypothetical protein TYRP_023004 [Tyrophagus putrescentiae]